MVAPKITITNGIADGYYTDLASAIAWLQQYTNAPITNASLVGDTFGFDVPAGSDFGLTNGFMGGSTGNLTDNDGLISILGDNALSGTSGVIILKNIRFGYDCLQQSSANISLENITFLDNNCSFGSQFSGVIDILGNIGANETSEVFAFFEVGSNATINVLASKQTSNAGGIEGDLQTAITNGATVNFIL